MQSRLLCSLPGRRLEWRACTKLTVCSLFFLLTLQLFWWGVALYGVRLGQAWTVVGTLFNSLCMVRDNGGAAEKRMWTGCARRGPLLPLVHREQVGVTQLNEARMLERPERAALWREYQRTTSVWVPWFKRK